MKKFLLPFSLIAFMSMLMVGAQVSLGASASWLSAPQDSAWENPNNWTIGGPPNGSSDTATFAQSSLTDVNISTSIEVNSIVFTPAADSFTFDISPFGAFGGEIIISGTGVTNNGSVAQTFVAGNGGQIVFNNASSAASAHMSILNGAAQDTTSYTIFNDTSSAAGASIENFSASGFDGDIGRTIFNGASTADNASITNHGAGGSHGFGGQTIFNDTSTAANASIDNGGSGPASTAESSLTTFNDASTAGHATITNHGGLVEPPSFGGQTIFDGSSTADSAILIATGGVNGGGGGGIIFNGASTGGTARLEVFDNGYLDISGHQSNLTVGSIEGSGSVLLGANNLRAGTNNIDTSFSGVISGSGLLTKIGSGVLTLQTNHCIADSVGLVLVSDSIINLDFTGSPDIIASLMVNGVSQPPGIYGGPMSGAPNILPEFEGSGTVSVGPISVLGNISTRAFVQTGDNVMIGGFIVRGTESKKVIIRAIGPELTPFGIVDPLADPTLELHDSTGALIASNDNWQHTIIGGIITSDQVQAILDSGYEIGRASCRERV